MQRQTLGATGSKVAGTLSRSYINAQKAKGLEKYISPDKQVDASTCLLPERTWFVKNLHHNVNVPGLYNMLYTLSYAEDILTVGSLPDYPQFLNCPSDTCAKFEPAQEKNANDVDWGSYDKEARDSTFSFLEKMIDFITGLIGKIYRIISGQWIVDLVSNAAA